MKLDREIFMQEGKMHPKNYLQPNDYDFFVDFTRLPKKLNKNVKNLVYRPKSMAKLQVSFDSIVKECENEDFRRYQEKEAWKLKKHRSLAFHERLLPKPDSEMKIINDLM